MTKCLVIGGGFLGGHVAERLSAYGHDVTVFSRSFSDCLRIAELCKSGTIKLIVGDVPPGFGLEELIAEAEVVFYLAGSSTPSGADDDPGGSIMRSVVPAAATLDLMRRTSTRRIVVASSGGTVYGVPRHLPTDERHTTQPISLHGHNSLSVERYALFFASQYGFEPVILRYANPYGPGQLPRHGQGVIAAWCRALSEGGEVVVYGSPANQRDFLYVSDAAEATIAAAFGAPRPGTYNVGSGVSYTLREVLDLIQRAAGQHVVVRQVPSRGVDVPVTQLDCALLKATTGWEPKIELEEGILRSWRWAEEVSSR